MKSVVMDIVVVDVPPSLECSFKDIIYKYLGEHCRWTSHMLPFLCLGGSIEDCTKKLSWPILFMMKKTPPTILFLHLILIWDLAYYS
jgi:hypothetical protein